MAADHGNAPRGRPRFGRVLARASGSPVNLGVAGAAAVAAAALGSWPLLALGGAAYAAMVAFDAANPTFWKKTAEAGREKAPQLPATDEVTDPQTRDAVERLREARANIDRVLGEASPEMRAHLGTVEATVDELERRAAKLTVRAEQLARYLAQAKPDAVREEIKRITAREARASDATAKQQLGQARAAREDELRTLRELETTKERMDANLDRVVAMLCGLPSKVVHMRTLDDQAMDDLSGDMSAELRDLAGEMKTFEETLKTLVEVQPS